MKESKLAQYIKECFDTFSQERSNLYEDGWRMSYDAYRAEYSSANLQKWKSLEGHEWRSQVFVRLTKMKIIAAISQIEDIEMQGGKLPWDMSPTPLPEGVSGVMDPKEAEWKCNQMKRIINDNLAETEADEAFRASLLEQAVYGCGWIKAPVIRPVQKFGFQLVSPDPSMQLSPELMQRFGRFQFTQSTSHVATVEHVPVWDVFWDLEVANPQKGRGLIHRDKMSQGRFLDLMDRPGYDRQSILDVASRYAEKDSGVAEESDGPFPQKLSSRKRAVPVFEFYGRAPIKYVMEDNQNFPSEYASREVEILCTVAGDSSPVVIRRAVPNLFPMQTRPLHISRWEDIPGESGGFGIADNVKDAQMMTNGAVRCFIDNKALASNLLIFGKRNALAPGQSRKLWTGKYFELANHVVDWREAFGFAQVPDVSGGLIDLISMAERYADKESNLPSLLQGERERFSPKTAFESGQLLEAANKSLGRVIRNREKGHYVPALKALYYWEMMTNPNQEIKGDYNVVATGYTTYLNKIRRSQVIKELLAAGMSNPVLQMLIDIREHMTEIYKAADLDPDRFLKSQEEIQQKIMEAMGGLQPPPAGDPSQLPPPEGVTSA